MYSRVFFGDCRAGWINDITLGWGCSPRFKWKGEQNNIKDSLLKSRLTTTSWPLEIEWKKWCSLFLMEDGDTEEDHISIVLMEDDSKLSMSYRRWLDLYESTRDR